jgi:hypothetical protein
MKKIIYLLIFGLLFFASCDDDNSDKGYICTECSGLFSEKMDMWVANKLTKNPDNPNEYCLKVQIGHYESDTSWVPFCNDICGFDYEAGYQYVLAIERKKIGTDDDGNPIYKYCLLYIKSKKPMPMK